MDKTLAMDVAIDTVSFGVSSIGLNKFGFEVHMGAKDYVEYVIVDGLYRYMKFGCDIPISGSADVNQALYRILVLTAGKSILDMAFDKKAKIKQNALAIAVSEPVRIAVNSIRSKFM